MVSRRLLIAGLFASPLFIAATAQAGEWKPFDRAAFTAAQAAGKPILVDVAAPWCSVCRAQKPILAALTSQPAYRKLTVFEVDFDSQKDVLRILGVQKQSTLIAFKGKTETGRSVGDTNPASIDALLKTAI